MERAASRIWRRLSSMDYTVDLYGVDQQEARDAERTRSPEALQVGDRRSTASRCRSQSREIVGLIGHNGAGKSTFVSIVAGLVRPDGGALEIDCGKAEIGVAPQTLGLYPTATVREHLWLFGKLAGVKRPAIEQYGRRTAPHRPAQTARCVSSRAVSSAASRPPPHSSTGPSCCCSTSRRSGPTRSPATPSSPPCAGRPTAAPRSSTPRTTCPSSTASTPRWPSRAPGGWSPAAGAPSCWPTSLAGWPPRSPTGASSPSRPRIPGAALAKLLADEHVLPERIDLHSPSLDDLY